MFVFHNSIFTVIYGRRRLGKSTLISRKLGENDVHFSDYMGDYWEKLCRETVSGNEVDGITY